MAITTQKLTDQDRACLWASLRFVGEQTASLLQYLPSQRVQALQESLSQWSALEPQEQQQAMEAGFQELQGQDQESLLYHVEPTWISEAFRNESISALAIVLAKLPKAKIGGVLKDLPKDTRKALKKIKLKQVPASLQNWIWTQSENRFPRTRMKLIEEDEAFNTLKNLKLRQLFALLVELGISQMALAFSKVNRSALRAILNRLRTQDAKELKRRIKQTRSYRRDEQREAQMEILSLDLEKLSPEQIVQEIGFGVLSRIFGKGDQEVALYFMHQFPPHEAYILKRYLAQNQSTPEKIAKVKKRVLEACQGLPD